ncbi:MAG: conjugal transfer protein TraA [Sphingomonas sp.]|nr:MAG: conjugal transfer protein TraA [Sphingomonas sp.]
MAIYHLSVKTVSRATGRSAVAAAAYRTATVLENERDGLVHDYSRRSGVETAFIVAPEIAAWADDRSVLWNAAEAAEKRKDAKVAREYELALPCELDRGGREALVRAFAGEVVARFGVVADVAIHLPGREGDQRNHHAHVLTTTRAVTADGMGAKTRDLDVKQTSGPAVEALRELWAVQVNHALERIQEAARVDHRSLERQERPGQVPTQHMGPGATALERRAARPEGAVAEHRQPQPEAARVEQASDPVTRIGQHNAAVRERNLVLEMAHRAMEAAREAARQLEQRAAAGIRKVHGLLRGVGAMVRADRERVAEQQRQAAELKQRQEQERQRVEAEKQAEVQRRTVTQAERDAAWLKSSVKNPTETQEAAQRDVSRQRSRGPSMGF